MTQHALTDDNEARERGGRPELRAPVDRLVPVLVAEELGPDNYCAIRVFAPAEDDSVSNRLLFCYPGGGYSKEYYDPTFLPNDDYSMARDLARRGFIVVIADHLGVGASSHPAHPELIDIETMASANSQVVHEVMRWAAEGTLITGMPRREDAIAIGIAHSMGAGLLTLQQATFRDFAGIVTMGWSAVHMPSSAELVGAKITGSRTEGTWPANSPHYPGYARVVRGPLQHWAYHWDDVPKDVIEADDAVAVEFPPCAGRMNAPGVLAGPAATIEEPVFVMMGERDLRLADSDEVRPYSHSPDVVFFELAASGHCHNMASTRREAWSRIGAWCASIDPLTDLSA